MFKKIIILVFVCIALVNSIVSEAVSGKAEIIKLPQPYDDGKVSIEEALLLRRSVRDYKDMPLALNEISQLFWKAHSFCQTLSQGHFH